MGPLLTTFLLIILPVLLGLFCFVGLPAMYVVLGKRTVERLGFDRSGNLFMGLTVAIAVAAYVTPPKIIRVVTTPIGEMADALRARVYAGESGPLTVEKDIDWAQTLLMLVLDPPVLLWIAVVGGLGVLAVVSRSGVAREN